MSEPNTTNPLPGSQAPPAAPPPRRCRSLTVRGIQCRERALRGHDLCVTHATNRFPVCPTGPHVAIPLLESLDTIQVVATQVVQGLFADTLSPHLAGKILYACQVAALTLPRPARFKPADKRPADQEPVADVFPSLDGTLLGPSLDELLDPLDRGIPPSLALVSGHDSPGAPYLPAFGRCGNAEPSPAPLVSGHDTPGAPSWLRLPLGASRVGKMDPSPAPLVSAHDSMGAPYLPAFGRCGNAEPSPAPLVSAHDSMGAPYLPAVGRCGNAEPSPAPPRISARHTGCPISARFWQMWECRPSPAAFVSAHAPSSRLPAPSSQQWVPHLAERDTAALSTSTTPGHFEFSAACHTPSPGGRGPGQLPAPGRPLTADRRLW